MNIQQNISKNDFYSKISEILKSAKNNIIQTVNTTMVETYFEIGKTIVKKNKMGNKEQNMENRF